MSFIWTCVGLRVTEQTKHTTKDGKKKKEQADGESTEKHQCVIDVRAYWLLAWFHSKLKCLILQLFMFCSFFFFLIFSKWGRGLYVGVCLCVRFCVLMWAWTESRCLLCPVSEKERGLNACTCWIKGEKGTKRERSERGGESAAHRLPQRRERNQIKLQPFFLMWHDQTSTLSWSY